MFHCRAEGNPQPTIQWYKDGVLLENKNGITLEYFEAGLGDRGLYSCVATNSEGRISSPLAVLRLTDVIDFRVPIILLIPDEGFFNNVSSADVDMVHNSIAAFVSLLQGLNTGAVVSAGQQSFLIHSIGLLGGSVSTALGDM